MAEKKQFSSQLINRVSQRISEVIEDPSKEIPEVYKPEVKEEIIENNVQASETDRVGEQPKEKKAPAKTKRTKLNRVDIPTQEQTMSSCVVPLDEDLYFALKKYSNKNGKVPLRTMCYNIIRDFAIKEKIIQE